LSEEGNVISPDIGFERWLEQSLAILRMAPCSFDRVPDAEEAF